MCLYRSVPDYEEWKEERDDDYEPDFAEESTTDTDLLTDGGAGEED